MLRVKATLSYLALVTALVAVAVLLVSATVSELARTSTEASLRRAVVAAEQSARLDEAALLAKAGFLSTGDRLYRSLLGEFVKQGEGEEGEAESPQGESGPDFAYQRHIDAHEKLTAQKYRLDETAKAESEKRNGARSVLARQPVDLDIFIVLDAEGVGVAALGKDLYSWFGRDIGKEYPSVREVASGGQARTEYWMWAFKPGQEKRLHRVALAPIRRTEGEKPSGVVVLGYSVNDGVAESTQKLLSAETEESDQLLPHVVFFRGGDIEGSTFGAERQSAAASALGEAGVMSDKPFDIFEVKLSDAPHIAMSRQLTDGEAPVGVAVVSNLKEARAPLAALRVDLILLGIVFLVVGGVLLLVLILRFVKPVEDLENGIQEVIAGNKDYVWEQQSGHGLQSSLAHGLNLMSAFLQGKPMPDDDSTGASWGDLMSPSGKEPPKSQGPGQVQGVDLSALSAPPPKDDGEG